MSEASLKRGWGKIEHDVVDRKLLVRRSNQAEK